MDGTAFTVQTYEVTDAANHNRVGVTAEGDILVSGQQGPLGSAFGSEKATPKNGTYKKQKSSKSDDFEDFWYAVRDSNPRPSGP